MKDAVSARPRSPSLQMNRSLLCFAVLLGCCGIAGVSGQPWLCRSCSDTHVRRLRGPQSHPNSFVSRSVMLMRSHFVLKAGSGFPLWREVGVGWGWWCWIAFPSLKFLSKCVCVFGKIKHTLTRGDACAFLKGEKTHTWKSENKTALGAAGGFYFSHILTGESDAWTHQRVFFRPLMRTRLGFVIEFGRPGSIITTTKNLVQLFASLPPPGQKDP